MKANKYTSLFLGITIFMFGFLKHFSPFKDWVHAQITQSGLPAFSMHLVVVGELLAGILYLLPLMFRNKFQNSKKWLLISANSIVIVMMVVACYVHMQPEVSAEVLPLKIKAPYIPIIYIVMAFINLFTLRKQANEIK